MISSEESAFLCSASGATSGQLEPIPRVSPAFPKQTIWKSNEQPVTCSTAGIEFLHKQPEPVQMRQPTLGLAFRLAYSRDSIHDGLSTQAS
jgi:hypothetical protein